MVTGDFNGDGFDELAVGIPDQDVAGQLNAGGVNVIRGSANGLTAAGGRFWTRNTDGVGGDPALNARFGSVLAAGDFNDDGFDDLAFGVPTDTVNGVSSAGSVNVLYGSAVGLTVAGADFWTQGPNVLDAPEAGDGFGAALSVGDYNNDGFADLAIGAPGEDVGGAASAGAVNVLFWLRRRPHRGGRPVLVSGMARGAWRAEPGRLLRRQPRLIQSGPEDRLDR